jgi:hypothetical protein
VSGFHAKRNPGTMTVIQVGGDDLLLESCHKKQKSLNRQDARDAKFKTRSRGIVQNRVTVLDKAAFSFTATRQMKKILPSLATLGLERSGRLKYLLLGCGLSLP